MPRSQFLLRLSERNKELRKQFLPSRFSPTGSYTRAQYDNFLAYRVLVHAEIEQYLESYVSDYLTRAKPLLQAGKNLRIGSAILCVAKEKSKGSPSQFAEIEQECYLLRRQLDHLHEQLRRISSNNGVKASNFLSLYLPIGIDETNFDEQFFVDLNLLGSIRGDAAHKGVSGITSLPNPKEDKQLVDRIIKYLSGVEKTIEILR